MDIVENVKSLSIVDSRFKITVLRLSKPVQRIIKHESILQLFRISEKE